MIDRQLRNGDARSIETILPIFKNYIRCTPFLKKNDVWEKKTDWHLFKIYGGINERDHLDHY
jgi:hypothetical protein